MMFNILIISLHYPPDNIIAARRSEAYARHFHKFGITPTIVTDRYEKVFDDQGNWIGYRDHGPDDLPVTEEYDTHKVIRLPRYINPLQRFQKFMERIPLLSPLFTFIMNSLGHFDMHLLGHYSNYKRFLMGHLKSHQYDLILTIDGPHYHVRLAKLLHEKFKIPYVCDFRDLYDNNLLSKEYLPSARKKIDNLLKHHYFRKWLLKARFVSSVSAPYVDFCSRLAGHPGFEINNGYEPTDFPKPDDKICDQFQVIHLGTLYPQQDISIFIRGLRKFIIEKSPAKFKVMFIGLRMFNEAQIEEMKKYIDPSYLVLSGKIERKEALEVLLKGNILFYPAWTKYVGIYSGKIFEYLGARKPILFAPGDDGGVVDQLLAQTQAGVSAGTPEEVCSFITEKYNEWLQTGQVSYQGIEEEIMKYTRENQVRKMARLIRESIGQSKE